MNSTVAASNFAMGKTSVACAKVFVPFGIRSHFLFPFSATREYISQREARSIGCKNFRPDDCGLALICDWPKHLTEGAR